MPSESYTASDLFTRIERHRLVRCRACCIAVWPRQAKTHLLRAHTDVPAQTRAQIATELQTWPDLCLSEKDFTMPQGVQERVEGLPVYSDGLQCQLQPASCRYIVRGLASMQKHWREAHQWRATRRGGRRTPQQQKVIAAYRADAYRSVWCQQFFAHGTSKPYFEIARPALPVPGGEGGDLEGDALLCTVLADLACMPRLPTLLVT
jgi:hypothetical protein